MVLRGNVLMISFSGGRTSAYMTEKLLANPVAGDQLVVFANTGKENRETLDFVHACDLAWSGVVTWLEYDPVNRFKIVDYKTASRNGEPYEAIINKRRYLPNVVTRFCTQELKVRVFKHYMKSLGYRNWTSAVGIRFDEPKRWAKTCGVASKECWDVWLPLVDWQVTKPQVLEYWKGRPFDLQLKDYEGNCDLCFLKGKHKLMRIIAENPEKAAWWIEQEKKVGGTFIKNCSIEKFQQMIRQSPTLFAAPEDDIPCTYCVD